MAPPLLVQDTETFRNMRLIWGRLTIHTAERDPNIKPPQGVFWWDFKAVFLGGVHLGGIKVFCGVISAQKIFFLSRGCILRRALYLGSKWNLLGSLLGC